MSRFQKLSQVLWHCQYHIVWTPTAFLGFAMSLRPVWAWRGGCRRPGTVTEKGCTRRAKGRMRRNQGQGVMGTKINWSLTLWINELT